MSDTHTVGKIGSLFEYIRSPYFVAAQRLYPGYADHEAFAEEIQQEFGDLSRRAPSATDSMPNLREAFVLGTVSHGDQRHRHSPLIGPRSKFPILKKLRSQNLSSDVSSDRALVNGNSNSASSSRACRAAIPRHHPNTDVDQVRAGRAVSIEMSDFSSSSENAPTKVLGKPTWADQLLQVMADERQKRRPYRLANRLSRSLGQHRDPSCLVGSHDW